MPFDRQYISPKIMQKIIQQITQDLIDRLPENDQYYQLEDLRTWEFPTFVVRRIGVELKRNLSESMMIPKTDWANTNTEAVQNAWQQFIDAIRDEARLPASYAQAVIETGVSEVLDTLVQPRKNIPEIIFGSDEELNVDQVLNRLEAIVVYRHFGVLISRYLQKKEVEQLTKNRCANIIAKADKKLTSSYSPLDWSQLLEPLFVLCEGEIDTNLLRLFFEDKNIPRIARKFDLMNTEVSRAEFIEVLSSPDLLDFEGYEDDQSSLFEDQPTAEDDQYQEDPVVHDDVEEQNDDSEVDIEDTETSMSLREEPPAMPEEMKNETEDDDSLNGAFSDPSDEDDKKITSVEEDPSTEESKNDMQAEQHLKEEDRDKNSESSSSKNGSATKAENNEIESSPGEKREEETPMWMRYMSDEEIEEYKREQEAEDNENVDEDGFIDEPIIDLTQDASDKEIDRLMDILQKDREFFVEEIFRGSDRAFEEAVEDIAGYDSWRDVSKYIEKEVFKRNMVDMYSEAAVDFTDQLQSYFLEKQNRNKQEN